MTRKGKILVLFSFAPVAFCASLAFVINDNKAAVNTKASEGYSLTINYLDSHGDPVADAYSSTLEEGSKYKVDSPSVSGLIPLKPFVKGRLFEDTTVNVVYETYDAWDGTSSESNFVGSGTVDSPYLIQSAEDLARLANTTTTTTAYQDTYFKLTTSLDLAGHDWEPIATGNHGKGTTAFVSWFCGHFDGDNHIISNMTCNGTSTTIYGLFSGIKGGSVENLSISGSINTKSRGGSICYVVNGNVSFDNIHTYVNQSYSAEALCGGIYGICMASSNPVVKNCTNSGNITVAANKPYAGGLVGGSGSNDKIEMDNCINYGDITSAGTTIAGCIGCLTVASSVTNCTNYGDIKSTLTGNVTGYVGGVVGYCRNAACTLTNLDNYGDVSGAKYIGGSLSSAESQSHNLTNSENYGKIVGDSYVGGVVGSGKVLKVTDCTNYGEIVSTGKDGEGSTGGISGTGYKSTITRCTNYGNVSGYKLVGGIAGNGQQGHFDTITNYGNVKGTASSIAGIAGQLNENGSMKGIKNYGNVENTSANVNTGLVYGYQGIGSTVDMTGSVIQGRLTCNGTEKFTLGYTNCIEIKLYFNGEIYAYDNMQPGQTYTPKAITPTLEEGYELSDWYSTKNLTTKYVAEVVGTEGTNSNNALNFNIYCKAIKGYDLILSQIETCNTCTEYELVDEFREDISYLSSENQTSMLNEIVDDDCLVSAKLEYMEFLKMSNSSSANSNASSLGSIFGQSNNSILFVAIVASILVFAAIGLGYSRKFKGKNK